MVIAPEHPMLEEFKDEIKNLDEVKEYQDFAKKKSDFERSELTKEKTGVMLDGISAINPVNGKEIPIWISDCLLYTSDLVIASSGAMSLSEISNLKKASILIPKAYTTENHQEYNARSYLKKGASVSYTHLFTFGLHQRRKIYNIK